MLNSRDPGQALENWEAVPIAVPLAHAAEADRIRRAWSPVRVPGHWQLEDAFGPYEGLVGDDVLERLVYRGGGRANHAHAFDASVAAQQSMQGKNPSCRPKGAKE